LSKSVVVEKGKRRRKKYSAVCENCFVFGRHEIILHGQDKPENWTISFVEAACVRALYWNGINQVHHLFVCKVFDSMPSSQTKIYSPFLTPLQIIIFFAFVIRCCLLLTYFHCTYTSIIHWFSLQTSICLQRTKNSFAYYSSILFYNKLTFKSLLSQHHFNQTHSILYTEMEFWL
jgi:hypothetical protein